MNRTPKVPLYRVIDTMKAKGYKIFDTPSLPYNINLVGVRYRNDTQAASNQYNDELHVFWKDKNDQWIDYPFKFTTEPGITYLKNPMNPKGTAVLMPGQYLKCYKIGLHKGSPALEQVAPFKIWRDANKDGIIDYSQVNNIYTGLFEMNLHKGGTEHRIDGSSAGCQVIPGKYWADFWNIILRAEKSCGPIFSYTLIEIL